MEQSEITKPSPLPQTWAYRGMSMKPACSKHMKKSTMSSCQLGLGLLSVKGQVLALLKSLNTGSGEIGI